MKTFGSILLVLILISCSKPHKAVENKTVKISRDYPEFPGGTNELDKYLRENWQWREPKDTVEGNLFMSFIVKANGEITDVSVLKGLGCKSCEDEAFRLIKGMPKWLPAQANGKPIDHKASLRIMFQSSSIK